MDDARVLIQKRGPVGLMLFNQPDKLNTLDVPMLLAMEPALTELEHALQADVRPRCAQSDLPPEHHLPDPWGSSGTVGQARLEDVTMAVLQEKLVEFVRGLFAK